MNLQQITCWGWSEPNHNFPETSSAWRFVSMPIEFWCSWPSTKTLSLLQHFSAPLVKWKMEVKSCFFSCSNYLPPSRWKEDNYARRPASSAPNITSFDGLLQGKKYRKHQETMLFHHVSPCSTMIHVGGSRDSLWPFPDIKNKSSGNQPWFSRKSTICCSMTFPAFFTSTARPRVFPSGRPCLMTPLRVAHGSSTFRPGWSWRCLGSWHQSTESPRSPRRIDLGSMHLCQRRSKDHGSLSSFETWKQDVWTHIRSYGNGSRVIKTYEVPYLGEMNIHSRPILVSTRVPGFWPIPIFYSWPFSLEQGSQSTAHDLPSAKMSSTIECMALWSLEWPRTCQRPWLSAFRFMSTEDSSCFYEAITPTQQPITSMASPNDFTVWFSMWTGYALKRVSGQVWVAAFINLGFILKRCDPKDPPRVMVPLSENHTCLKGYTSYSKSSFHDI